MKRKLFLGALLALFLLVVSAAPALAWGGTNVDVVIDPFQVEGDIVVGETVTVSGGVTVVAESGAVGLLPVTFAEGEAGYSITDPTGVTIVSGSYSNSDFDMGLFYAGSDASFHYKWSQDIEIMMAGDYLVNSYGHANAAWWMLFWGGRDSAGCSDTSRFEATEPDPDPLSGNEGRFLVVLFDSRYYQATRWDGGWQARPQVTAEPTFIEGQHRMEGYRVEIPAGTTVSFDNGHRVSYFKVEYDNGALKYVPENLNFSNPVIISQLVDGEWVILDTFTRS